MLANGREVGKDILQPCHDRMRKPEGRQPMVEEMITERVLQVQDLDVALAVVLELPHGEVPEVDKLHAVQVRQAPDGPPDAAGGLGAVHQGLQCVDGLGPWALAHHVLLAPFQPLARDKHAQHAAVHRHGAVHESVADLFGGLRVFHLLGVERDDLRSGQRIVELILRV